LSQIEKKMVCNIEQLPATQTVIASTFDGTKDNSREGKQGNNNLRGRASAHGCGMGKASKAHARIA
jgi:hypothetical protein